MQSHITHENCKVHFRNLFAAHLTLTCWTVGCGAVLLDRKCPSAQHFIFRVRLILWTVHPEDGDTLIILNIATTHPMTQCHIWQSSACLWGPQSTHSVSLVDSHCVTTYINAHYCNAILVCHGMQLLKAWTDSRNWTVVSLLEAW